MSRIEDFDNAFWSDPDVEPLTPDATLLYLWSWTNQRCGMAGLYKVTAATMARESKVSPERLPAALDELARADFAFYDGSVLWVRARAKRLRSKSPRMATSVARDVEKLAFDHPMRVRFLAYYADCAWLREALEDLYRTSSEVHVTPLPEHNQVTLPGASLEPLQRLQGQGQGAVKEEKETPVARARTRPAVEQDVLPSDVPGDLRPAAERVLNVLRGIFDERGGSRPTRRGVGLAMLAFPHRDHTAVAAELQHWALAGNGSSRSVRDWVRQYRTFLERSVDGSPSKPGARRNVGGGSKPRNEWDAALAAQMEAMGR